jgi:hypothetical protein
VLDDNCTLCLPIGERIKLNPATMRMLFEVEDLLQASPATVSRCGMVYLAGDELGCVAPGLRAAQRLAAVRLLQRSCRLARQRCSGGAVPRSLPGIRPS